MTSTSINQTKVPSGLIESSFTPILKGLNSPRDLKKSASFDLIPKTPNTVMQKFRSTPDLFEHVELPPPSIEFRTFKQVKKDDSPLHSPHLTHFLSMLNRPGSSPLLIREDSIQLLAESIRKHSRDTPLIHTSDSPVIFESPSIPTALFKKGKDSLRALICYDILKAAGLEDTIPMSTSANVHVELQEENSSSSQFTDAECSQDNASDDDTRSTSSNKSDSHIANTSIKEVQGIIIEKIEPIFIGNNPSKPLDLLYGAEKDIQDFYRKIDFDQFVKCFIAIIILRPSDAGLMNLKLSNILFQWIDQEDSSHLKLKPRLIDLDETLPISNDFLENNSKISLFPSDREKNVSLSQVAAVKCGLMGLPHARAPLFNMHIDFIKDIISKKNDIIHAANNHIQKKVFFEPHIEALEKVLDRMDSFINAQATLNTQTTTLQDLFFYVFPEYNKQWIALDHIEEEFNPPLKMSPIQKAVYIGHFSLDTIRKEKEGRAKQQYFPS